MICNAADGKRLHFMCPSYPAHICPKPRLQFFWDAGDPILCRKDIMKQQAGVRVIGHCDSLRYHKCSTVPGGTPHFPGFSTRQCLPGYSRSRLAALRLFALFLRASRLVFPYDPPVLPGYLSRRACGAGDNYYKRNRNNTRTHQTNSCSLVLWPVRFLSASLCRSMPVELRRLRLPRLRAAFPVAPAWAAYLPR